MKLPVNYELITQVERRLVREEYVKVQDGLCYHCKEPLTGLPSREVSSYKINVYLFPKGFFSWPIHLHHNHDTGMTIGAVHCRCNAVLFQHHGE